MKGKLSCTTASGGSCTASVSCSCSPGATVDRQFGDALKTAVGWNGNVSSIHVESLNIEPIGVSTANLPATTRLHGQVTAGGELFTKEFQLDFNVPKGAYFFHDPTEAQDWLNQIEDETGDVKHSDHTYTLDGLENSGFTSIYVKNEDTVLKHMVNSKPTSGGGSTPGSGGSTGGGSTPPGGTGGGSAGGGVGGPSRGTIGIGA